MLIATRPILLNNRQYQPGDVLPDGAPLKDRWIQTGSAVERPDGYKSPPASVARPVVLEGTPRIPSDGSPGDVVGHVPETAAREKPARKRRAATK